MLPMDKESKSIPIKYDDYNADINTIILKNSILVINMKIENNELRNTYTYAIFFNEINESSSLDFYWLTMSVVQSEYKMKEINFLH